MDSLDLSGARGPIAAMLFMQSSTYAMDAFSALNSSPWTAETFSAGDEDRERACKEYVWHAVGFCGVYAAASATMAQSWWPIIGTAITLTYMVWLYWRALARGKAREGQ